MSKLVYVLNGPNLNLLGKRQPDIYGYDTLADVEAACRQVAEEFGLELRFHQSNAEHQIIDWIHEARETAAGIIINPAAFTHPSVAILDALNTFKEGFKTLITQIYSDDDERLETDVQFGVTAALTGAYKRHDEPHPEHPEVGAPWYSLDHTLVMVPGEARLPRPPIK